MRAYNWPNLRTGEGGDEPAASKRRIVRIRVAARPIG